MGGLIYFLGYVVCGCDNLRELRLSLAPMKNTNLKIKKVWLFICPFSLLIFKYFRRSITCRPWRRTVLGLMLPALTTATILVVAVCRGTGQSFSQFSEVRSQSRSGC